MADSFAFVPFPPVADADAAGLLATTRHLDHHLLLSAYLQGIFPWTHAPIGWFAPPRRALLLPERAHFPRNFNRLLRQQQFSASLDTCFDRVIACVRAAHASKGEWLTPAFAKAYIDLWRRGFGHSVEIWQQGQLVGGLYGVQVGLLFCAESMFCQVANASKAALFALLQARALTGVTLIDVQVLNDTTERLGAIEVPRSDFMHHLASCARAFPTYAGRRWPQARWRLCDGAPLGRTA